MSLLIVPNKRVNYLRNGGWQIDAVLLEKIAKATGNDALRLIAQDIRQLWWWVKHPESAAIALDRANDSSEPYELEP